MKLKVNWTRVKKMYVVFYRGSITKFQIIKAVAGVQKQVYYCIDYWRAKDCCRLLTLKAWATLSCFTYVVFI